MSTQSYVFDFNRVDDFFDRWNVDFKTVGDFGVANRFEIVILKYAPTNINECLSNGRLTSEIDTQSNRVKMDCTLKWSNEEITIANDVDFNLSTNIVPVKAIFIRHKSSEVVLGYSINISSFEVTNHMIFEKDTILWSIRNG